MTLQYNPVLLPLYIYLIFVSSHLGTWPGMVEKSKFSHNILSDGVYYDVLKNCLAILYLNRKEYTLYVVGGSTCSLLLKF